jgi:hypothetical protein
VRKLRFLRFLQVFCFFVVIVLVYESTFAAVPVEAVANTRLAIYRYATSGSLVVGAVPLGTELELLEPSSSHYKILYGGVVGWISRTQVTVMAVDGIIGGEGVAYRSSPHDVEDNILGTLRGGLEIAITGVVGNYCEVRYGDLAVYVARSSIRSGKLHLVKRAEAPPLPERVDDASGGVFTGDGKDIAYRAMDYLGGRYVWGGNNLETGVDCSGFVRQIYKLFGVSLSGASYQLVKYGTPVEKDELVYGDLVFFAPGGSGIGHIGIYVSNDWFVHAAGRKIGIVMGRLSARKDYVTARRVVA